MIQTTISNFKIIFVFVLSDISWNSRIALYAQGQSRIAYNAIPEQHVQDVRILSSYPEIKGHVDVHKTTKWKMVNAYSKAD